MKGDLSTSKEMHQPVKDRGIMREKLSKVRKKRHLFTGLVCSLILVFCVPKGDAIPLVYYGSNFKLE